MIISFRAWTLHGRCIYRSNRMTSQFALAESVCNAFGVCRTFALCNLQFPSCCLQCTIQRAHIREPSRLFIHCARWVRFRRINYDTALHRQPPLIYVYSTWSRVSRPRQRNVRHTRCVCVCLRHVCEYPNGRTNERKANKRRKIQIQNKRRERKNKTHKHGQTHMDREKDTRHVLSVRIPYVHCTYRVCARVCLCVRSCVCFSCCNQLVVNELGVCHLNLRTEWGYCVIYWVWKSSHQKTR